MEQSPTPDDPALTGEIETDEEKAMRLVRDWSAARRVPVLPEGILHRLGVPSDESAPDQP